MTRITQMNLETTKPGSVTLQSSDYRQSGSDSWIETQSPPSLLRCYPGSFTFCLGKSLSSIPAFLISFWASGAFAGDAVAIGYNPEGVWTAVTYYSSSTPKGGKDYKTEKEAQELALRDVRKRSEHKIATTSILASSDSTGFVAVARGQTKAGKDVNVVGRGETQSKADKKAFDQLNAAGAGAKQKIVYRYFSHGGASRTGD